MGQSMDDFFFFFLHQLHEWVTFRSSKLTLRTIEKLFDKNAFVHLTPTMVMILFRARSLVYITELIALDIQFVSPCGFALHVKTRLKLRCWCLRRKTKEICRKFFVMPRNVEMKLVGFENCERFPLFHEQYTRPSFTSEDTYTLTRGFSLDSTDGPF